MPTAAHLRTSAPPYLRTLLLATALGLLVGHNASAQVRQPDETISAGEGAHILSDISTNVGADSRPMHDGSLTLGETSGGPVGSGPVSEMSTRSMLSGPVSSMSQGPMRGPRVSLSGGSMTEASSGAVKHDIDSPLGARISDPLRELGSLQKEMRARREQAEQAAIAGAREPAVPPLDESPRIDQPVVVEEPVREDAPLTEPESEYSADAASPGDEPVQ